VKDSPVKSLIMSVYSVERFLEICSRDGAFCLGDFRFLLETGTRDFLF